MARLSHLSAAAARAALIADFKEPPTGFPKLFQDHIVNDSPVMIFMHYIPTGCNKGIWTVLDMAGQDLYMQDRPFYLAEDVITHIKIKCRVMFCVQAQMQWVFYVETNIG